MDRWQENPRHLGPSERAASPSDTFFIEHKEAHQKSTTRLSAREQASWAGRFSDRWSGGSRDYLPVSRTVPDPDPWHTPRRMTVSMEMRGVWTQHHTSPQQGPCVLARCEGTVAGADRAPSRPAQGLSRGLTPRLLLAAHLAISLPSSSYLRPHLACLPPAPPHAAPGPAGRPLVRPGTSQPGGDLAPRGTDPPNG